MPNSTEGTDETEDRDSEDRDKKNTWLSLQKTKGSSDLYLQSNLWKPGGSTGWHSHPGHSLIIVTAGTVTAYEGDDPDRKPTVYTTGMGTNSAKGGYKKRPRQLYGPDYKAEIEAPPAVEMTA